MAGFARSCCCCCKSCWYCWLNAKLRRLFWWLCWFELRTKLRSRVSPPVFAAEFLPFDTIWSAIFIELFVVAVFFTRCIWIHQYKSVVIGSFSGLVKFAISLTFSLHELFRFFFSNQHKAQKDLFNKIISHLVARIFFSLSFTGFFFCRW